jgi:phage-related minor tail protein
LNTLATLAAVVALIWAAVYVIGTVGEPGLGYAVLVLAVLMMVGTLLAATDDVQAVTQQSRRDWGLTSLGLLSVCITGTIAGLGIIDAALRA